MTKEQLWELIESYHVAHIAHGQRTVADRRAVLDTALTELFARIMALETSLTEQR